MMMVAVRMINAAVVMRVPPHGFGLVCWSWLVSFSFVFGFVQCGVEHDDELFGLVGREPVGVGAYGIAFADGQDDAVAFRRVWGSFAVPFRIVVGAQVEFVAPSLVFEAVSGADVVAAAFAVVGVQVVGAVHVAVTLLPSGFIAVGFESAMVTHVHGMAIRAVGLPVALRVLAVCPSVIHRLRQRGVLAPVIVELFAAAAVAHARVGRSFADHHMVLPVMALYRLR